VRLEALGVDDGVVDERPRHCPQLPEDLVHQPLEQRRRVLGTEGGAQGHVDVVVAPERHLVLIPLSDPDLVVPHSEVQRGEAVAPPHIIEQLVCDRHRVLVRHSFVVVRPVIPADALLRPIPLCVLLPAHDSLRHKGVVNPTTSEWRLVFSIVLLQCEVITGPKHERGENSSHAMIVT
jgi:hypothetical protein